MPLFERLELRAPAARLGIHHRTPARRCPPRGRHREWMSHGGPPLDRSAKCALAAVPQRQVASEINREESADLGGIEAVSYCCRDEDSFLGDESSLQRAPDATIPQRRTPQYKKSGQAKKFFSAWGA